MFTIADRRRMFNATYKAERLAYKYQGWPRSKQKARAQGMKDLIRILGFLDEYDVYYNDRRSREEYRKNGKSNR